MLYSSLCEYMNFVSELNCAWRIIMATQTKAAAAAVVVVARDARRQTEPVASFMLLRYHFILCAYTYILRVRIKWPFPNTLCATPQCEMGSLKHTHKHALECTDAYWTHKMQTKRAIDMLALCVHVPKCVCVCVHVCNHYNNQNNRNAANERQLTRIPSRNTSAMNSSMQFYSPKSKLKKPTAQYSSNKKRCRLLQQSIALPITKWI